MDVMVSAGSISALRSVSQRPSWTAANAKSGWTRMK